MNISAYLMIRAVLNTSKIRYKSNSQRQCRAVFTLICCAQYFKDTIQEQFTTVSVGDLNHKCCAQYFKDTIQEQFTTQTTEPKFNIRCAQYFKDTIQEQFTTYLLECYHLPSCAQYFKDTIQEQFTTKYSALKRMCQLCSILQRYDTRAIHNYELTQADKREAVLNTSKIRYKSNSQLDS